MSPVEAGYASATCEGGRVARERGICAPMVDVAEGAQLAKNIDWNRVASYYDAYVRTDLDLSFFLKHARESDGPLLELMCGPGRITMPLVEAGYDVTGIDSSSGLLDRF